MAGLILAAVTPDNTPHGYNWTFAYPMLLFIVIAAVLYYLFGRPHRRVPPRPISAGGATTESHFEPGGAHLATSADASDDDAGAGPTAAGESPAAQTAAAETPAGETAAGDQAGGDATAEQTGAQE